MLFGLAKLTRSALRLGWPALISLLAGCGSAGHGSSEPSGSGGGPSEDGGTGNLSIAFTLASPLIYVPGDVRTLGVQVTPPGAYSVHFALVGDPRDAFLDLSLAQTGDDGKTSVELTAPTSPSSFSVRASTGSAFTVLDASPGTSFGKINVMPVYSGQRAVTTWTATVRTGLDCATAGVPPSDGSLRIEAAVGSPLVIDKVPADTGLTVTVRAGHFAGGCAEVPRIDASLTTDVAVTVTDRPLQLDAMNLPLSLSLDLTQPVIDSWAALASEMSLAFAGGATTDATTLLDAMNAGLDPASSSLFAAARNANGWDALLGATALGTNVLRDAVTRYVIGGLPPTGTVFIAGRLTSTSSVTGALAIGALGGFPPATVGAADTVFLSLNAETDDRVLFGGTATWQPSNLAAALSYAPASTEVPGATSVTDALVRWADCAQVATSLVDISTGFAYGSCDAACIQTECALGIAALWRRASTTDPAPLPMVIAQSGRATLIDDTAHPERIEGSWLGTTSVAGGSVTFSGSALTGAAP